MSDVLEIGIEKLNPKKKKVKDKIYSIGTLRDGTDVVRTPEEHGDDAVLPVYSVSRLENQDPRGEVSLIHAYRELAKSSEVDEAIREIVNETFSSDGDLEAFRPAFKSKTNLSKSIQEKTQDAFDYVYHVILDFDRYGKQLFKQYYIDGKIIYHIAVDLKQQTIRRVQVLDPTQCRRVKHEVYNKDSGLVDYLRTKTYYYYIPDKNLDQKALYSLWNTPDYEKRCYRFNEEAIAYADSGIVDRKNNIVLSNLYKVIKPYNNLMMMEEAMMIYRIVRAPERRAFYIDVGSMGTEKAMQHVQSVKNMFNNQTVFDSSTNSFVNKKTVHSMIEDYYLPRRDGQRGTEIQTIGGAENLGVTKDIEYLKDKFYKSLNVPLSRISSEMQHTTLLLGRMSEMQRDEYRFKRFIEDVRAAFIPFIEKLLMTEMILRGVVTKDEWEQKIVKDLWWDYKEDNSFTEIKENEKLRSRLELLDMTAQHLNNYFSRPWVMRHVLNLTDDDIAIMDEEIKADKKSNPPDEFGGGGGRF